jgi:hypothetical protein
LGAIPGGKKDFHASNLALGVGERTRIINRLKSALTRLGIRGFKPQLRKAPQLLESVRTPEDTPIPPNTLDEMRRDLTRLALIREQIEAIEQARVARLEKAPQTGPNAMIRMLASIRGVGIERRKCWCKKCSRAICMIAGQLDATPGSPVRRMKADPNDVRKVSPNQATPGCAAA